MQARLPCRELLDWFPLDADAVLPAAAWTPTPRAGSEGIISRSSRYPLEWTTLMLDCPQVLALEPLPNWACLLSGLRILLRQVNFILNAAPADLGFESSRVVPCSHAVQLGFPDSNPLFPPPIAI